jgi:hypothetical protein
MTTIEVVFTPFQRYVVLTHRLTYSLTNKQIAPDIRRGQLQLSIYQTGLMYAILKECRAIADSCHADRVMMAEIHTRLEETFMLTPEQKVCIQFSSFTATEPLR